VLRVLNNPVAAPKEKSEPGWIDLSLTTSTTGLAAMEGPAEPAALARSGGGGAGSSTANWKKVVVKASGLARPNVARTRPTNSGGALGDEIVAGLDDAEASSSFQACRRGNSGVLHFRRWIDLPAKHGVGMEKNELMSQLFSADSLQMIRNFKDLFDPENRLNPGKVLPTGKGCLEIGKRR